ncbi:hypothetical protein AVEN_141127-1 [Araneus ventricosus]|uniref:Uncharacterized protein n=1 Tax=Araneus ventricosus TaxID=182803 RepID=A0A4Y2KCG6_ARAVE|nr:hypothetical protein AVEN_141127-1 [Araneus ventricosus]
MFSVLCHYQDYFRVPTGVHVPQVGNLCPRGSKCGFHGASVNDPPKWMDWNAVEWCHAIWFEVTVNVIILKAITGLSWKQVRILIGGG